MHITTTKLKELLIGSGVVGEKIFNSALDESARLGQPVTEVLVGRGDLSEEYLLEILEPYFDAPIVDLRKKTLNKDIINLIPESFAKSKNIMAFEKDQDKNILRVAMADPFDYETIEFLRAKLGVDLEPHLTSRSSLRFGFKQYKQQIGQEFDTVITENVNKVLNESTGEADMSKLADALPVVTILDSIVEHAVALNASDIHFEPMQNTMLIRYRIDGVLEEILTLQKIIEPILVARVKILANLQIDEHRAPQDGRFRFEIEEGGYIDLRVNVMPVMHGEKVEMRLLKSSSRVLTLEELGLSGEAITIVNEEIHKEHGMILVTGPTGHGKTTTLYAILHILNTPEVNITTIEDPIEYEVSRVNQTQVNVKSGITFANGLRALVRQNPDIIMVGEIRDSETAEISVHAALTGHLLLSSLHTNDASSAVPRLIDMKIQPFLLASTLNLVIAQRLVRKICAGCVTSYATPPEVKNLIKKHLAQSGETYQEVPKILFRGKGCNLCNHSGFQGQIGIFELLHFSDGIKELILKMAPAMEIKKLAMKEGMTTMFVDGLQKVERGVTTIEEVLRVVNE
ncbi:MAG TPA: GspE/PulE family protein [Candidatus Methylomirabilis sp.]|nr:GspE/PulE family protein [Candidatus Methylomirabilis sp.]